MIAQLARPLPAPYDASVDGSAAVAATRARARRSGKLLLIDLGANWCVDCRVLAGILARPEMAGFVARHFEVVTVDVGRFDRNLAVPRAYKLEMQAIPALIVVDPVTGAVRNRGQELAVGDASVQRPQAVANRLASWTR